MIEYGISGRMSGMVSGKNFSITKYVMSNDIDDIQDPRYHMRRRTFFNVLVYCVREFACTWMALRARNPCPSGLATLDPQSTCHEPRPGPKLACGVRAGSLRATEPRARGKTRGRKRKKCRWAKKTHLYMYVYFPPSFTIFALLFSPPPSRNSDQGSHSRLSSPLPATVCALRFYRDTILAISSLVDSR